MESSRDILALILGGGSGSRLFPLTEQRSKPAVQIAGKYRLIDIPLSNCINSGIDRIAVLTQFNSVSLHRHITNAYPSNSFRFNSGWVQIRAADQTIDNTQWYQGTADAVRKNITEIQATHAKNVLILASDHLYRMDYAKMAQFHWETKADITVAVHPVAASDASRFGILKIDDSYRIEDFIEKPKDRLVLADFENLNNPGCPFLGSMGIYLFRTEALLDLLNEKDFEDFGSNVIPYAIKNNVAYGYPFAGYWEDIGTIRSYYEANLMLTYPDPPFNFHDDKNPIYTSPSNLDCTIVDSSILKNVLLTDGSHIQEAYICHTIVGARSQIRSGVEITDSILMGADYYENIPDSSNQKEIPLGIGKNSKITGAIIDKNTRIGENVVMHPFPAGTNFDRNDWVVRDGIIVIPKGRTVQSGSYLGPEKMDFFFGNRNLQAESILVFLNQSRSG